MSKRPERIDPAGCGCTDCVTGYSVPLDRAALEQVDALMAGRHFVDATGIDWGDVRERMDQAAQRELTAFLKELG